MPERKTSNKSIFVSSTFRDMQTERDALRDFVLPRVNEFAAKYGRAVEIIDLRWGVDTAYVTEAEQNKKVLRTCLDEIKRSRPFFLGLIGDRYGWTPPSQYMEAALESVHFLIEDKNMSVTALEIEYGVLRSKNPPVCFFYFRESPDYAVMPEKLKQIYKDEADSLAKLEKLKEEIRALYPQDIKNYTAEIHENGLTVSKEWAAMVAEDIKTKLRDEWGEPSKTPMDWREQERDMQEAFRKSRTKHFAGRTAAINDMAAFCMGAKAKPQLLMMQGEAGSGKSGLLCKVMDKIDNKCLLLPFSCGISSRSSLVENMLKYFISLLCEKLTLEDDSETMTKFQDIKDRFIELLFAACAKTRVVAVVDALDQLIGSDEARRMLWISGKLPENFRLLCSIIDGPETEAVKRLGGEVRPIPPVNKEDEAAIIHDIAARHHKQINGSVVEHIIQKQTSDSAYAAQNPLYLSLITQDLVMMDRYELETVQKYMEGGASQPEALAKFMRERIDETPGDPEGAYLAILDRLEKLIGKDFVRGVCGMIAISRSGLRESDMEGAFKELEMDFNPADFSWLRQMMRGHFSQGDMQQWDFSHQNLRRALRKNMPEELKRLNEGIVIHFRNVMAQDDFAAREIIHHLCAANRPDIAAEVIAAYFDNYDNVLAQGLADIYSEYKEGEAFLLKVPNNVENVEDTKHWIIAEIIRNVLPLLPEKTRPFRIEWILAAIAMLEGREDAITWFVKAACEINAADLYKETGESENAEKYYLKSLDKTMQIYEQTGDITTLRNLSTLYGRMGDYLKTLGRTEETGEYYLKSNDADFKIYEKTGDASALGELSMSYCKMGDHLTSLGQTEEAGEYYRKFLDASMQNYGQTGASKSLSDLSISYRKMGDHLTALGRTEEAGEYYRKSLDARMQIYEQTGAMSAFRELSSSYGKMGDHLTSLGQTEEACEYYRKSLDARMQIHEQTGTMSAFRDLSLSYGKMGIHLTTLGQMEEAGEYYRKFIDANLQIYGQTGAIMALKDLSAAYNMMGDYMMMLGRTEEAGEYYLKCFDANMKIYKQEGTTAALRELSVSYSKIGDNLTALGRLKEAGEYYQKDLVTSMQIYKQTGTTAAMLDMAVSYNKIGDNKTLLSQTEEAELYYRKSLELTEQIYQQTGTTAVLRELSVIYEKMGDNLTAMGRTEEAEEYYQKDLAASRQIYEKTGTVTALNDLSGAYFAMGEHLTALERTEQAGEYYMKSIETRMQVYEKTGAIPALKDLSVVCYKIGDNLTVLGRMEEAGEYYMNFLNARVKIYEQTGSMEALKDLSVSYSTMGDYLMALERFEEAGEYYMKLLDARIQIYEQTKVVSALRNVSVAYGRIGDQLKMSGKTEEADEYYIKSLDIEISIYKHTGTLEAQSNLIVSFDKAGDNKSALGLYNEAHTFFLKAFELYEDYIKKDPSEDKHYLYFRDKAMKKEDET